MKNILFLTSFVLLSACGDMKDTLGIDQGGGDSTPPPAAGTILSESCQGTTKVVETADGNGGSTTQSTEKSEECGYVPPRGELLDQQCDVDTIGVEIFTYADGEGGSYTESTDTSVECGYEEPQLEVTVRGAGDRFKPVVIDVQTTQYGEPIDAEWDYETTDSTIGVVEKIEKDSQLHILGDSRLGEGVVLINGEEYQYSIVEEQRCAIDKDGSGFSNTLPLDCEGHWMSGVPARGMIWYGEEDKQIVEVEFVHWEAGWRQGEDGTKWWPVGWDEPGFDDGEERFTVGYGYKAIRRKAGHKVYENGVKYQNKANEQFEDAGIHIRLKLVAAYESDYSSLGYGFRIHMQRGEMVGADIVGQTRVTRPGTCGVAYAASYFGPGAQPRTFQSACGYNVWLHELGHNVGMAHGPFNSTNEATGYTFPAFGHGTNSFCSYFRSSIMSYGRNKEMFSNSKMSCRDYGVPEDKYDGDIDELPLIRGSSSEIPESSDEAYHMNRIRFNLALIWHQPEESLPVDQRVQYFIDYDQYQGEIIVD